MWLIPVLLILCLQFWVNVQANYYKGFPYEKSIGGNLSSYFTVGTSNITDGTVYKLWASEVTTLAGETTNGQFTLNGQLTDLGGAASVTVYFQYGYTSGVYPYTTTSETLSSVGVFDSTLETSPDHRIYYRAVSENGLSTVYGSEATFVAAGKSGYSLLQTLLTVIISLAAIVAVATTTKSWQAVLFAILACILLNVMVNAVLSVI
jgi:hypothetical protein